MLSRAGSGLLSSGMQQVSDRPFMLSEWIHTFPNEYGGRRPGDCGRLRHGIAGLGRFVPVPERRQRQLLRPSGTPEWDVTAPQLMGMFPCCVAPGAARRRARIADGGCAQSAISVAVRGRNWFQRQSRARLRSKELDSSKVPARALAVARSVVEFTAKPQRPPLFRCNRITQNGALISSTKELAWHEEPRAGRRFLHHQLTGDQSRRRFRGRTKVGIGRCDD